MRILHYIPSIDRTSGGTTTYIQSLGSEQGLLDEVHILTHPSPNPVKIPNCHIHNVTGYGLLGLAFHRECRRLLQEIQPDVVHVNCCWKPSCSAILFLAKKMGFKVVLSPHGMLEPWIIKRHYWSRKLPALLLYQRRAVATADLLVSTADSETANLLKLGYNGHVETVPLGLDVKHIALKSSWEPKRMILFLSRVHVKKGIEFLVEAVDALRNELNGYKVIVAGEGDADYVSKLSNDVAARGLGDIIKIVGGVYGDGKWQLFKDADFFVLPTYSENFGLAVAESLACGTPVITTVGTPWEDLNTYRCGAWIEIGANPLADAIRDILKCSEKELEQMGRNGRKLIESKYSAEVMAKRMRGVYERVMAKKSSL